MSVAVLRPNSDGTPFFNVEAEQNVLGTLLLDQRLIVRAADAGGARLFWDPVHAALFDEMTARDARGETVTPVTMRGALGEAMQPLGGPAYLGRLASASLGVYALPGYLAALRELADKRDLQSALVDAQASLARGEMRAEEVSVGLEGRMLALGDNGQPQRAVSMLKAAYDAVQQAERAFAGEDNGGVRSGIGALDALVPGFHRGELTLLGARPSMGKTAVGLAIGLNAARAGHKVGIVSLEMTPEAMAARALSEETAQAGCAVPYIDQRSGKFDERQRKALVQAAIKVSELPITFLPRTYSNIASLTSGARHIKRAVGLELLIVDYAQLLQAEGRSRYEQITAISIALKGLAVQLDIPVIALSQLSRDLEKRDDKRPMLSDLRESGQLEQDADNVMFCYREEYYLERLKPAPEDPQSDHLDWQAEIARVRNRLEIIVAKQRMGPIGTAHVMFAAATNSIWGAT